MGATFSVIFVGHNWLTGEDIASVIIQPSMQNPESVTLYLGRSDIRRSFGPAKGSNQGYDGTGFVYSGNLFKEEDVGKTIPVWISTEPPPY